MCVGYCFCDELNSALICQVCTDTTRSYITVISVLNKFVYSIHLSGKYKCVPHKTGPADNMHIFYYRYYYSYYYNEY